MTERPYDARPYDAAEFRQGSDAWLRAQAEALPSLRRVFLHDPYPGMVKIAPPSPSIPKRAQTPTVIHVNQQIIKSNRKHGTNEPPLTIRKGRNGQKAQRAHEVIIAGPSKIVHSPHKPLKCGARIWIETDAPVELINTP